MWKISGTLPHLIWGCNEKYSNHCQLYLIKPLNFHNVITAESKYLTTGYLLPGATVLRRLLFCVVPMSVFCRRYILVHVEWDNFNQTEPLIILHTPQSNERLQNFQRSVSYWTRRWGYLGFILIPDDDLLGVFHSACVLDNLPWPGSIKSNYCDFIEFERNHSGWCRWSRWRTL